MEQQKLSTTQIIVIFGIIVFSIAGYFIYNQQKQLELQKEQNKILIEQSENTAKELEKTNQEVAKVKKEAEKPKIIQAPAPAPQGSSLSSIIKSWRPRIAYVFCTWGTIEASGSGLLMKNWIATNEHVFRYQGQRPSSCAISLPDRNVIYYADTTRGSVYGGGIDMAGITLDNQDIYTDTLGSKEVNYCKRRADIGESIVILGYPYTGSTNDITATEGIVSGYDGYYYVTSAKIEHGNSGGVAVLIKDNCYLGVPSSAAVGTTESLGRILDSRIMFDAQYFETHPSGI